MQNSSEYPDRLASCRVHFGVFFPTTFLEIAVNGFIQIAYIMQSRANAAFAFVVSLAFVVVLCINRPLHSALLIAIPTSTPSLVKASFKEFTVVVRDRNKIPKLLFCRGRDG